MNTMIEQIVREHVPESASAQLSFVKFNTSGSPKRPMPKVLFFCFFGDETQPRFVLKTVRSSRDNAVISQGFNNLKQLSGDSSAFSRPIWVGEVDGIAWSIETAFAGFRAESSNIPQIVDAYVKFQKNAARAKKTVTAQEVASGLISALGFQKSEAETLWNRLDRPADITLLPQHGDLTQDNVLVGDAGIGFVDTDWYMQEGIAGFDLFHLLSRSEYLQDASLHMRAYRQAIGMQREFTRADLFLWLIQERVLKQMQGSPQPTEDLAHAFDALIARFKFA